MPQFSYLKMGIIEPTIQSCWDYSVNSLELDSSVQETLTIIIIILAQLYKMGSSFPFILLHRVTEPSW